MNLNQSAIRQYYQFRHFVEKTKNYIYVHVSGLIESAIFGLAHVTAQENKMRYIFLALRSRRGSSKDGYV